MIKYHRRKLYMCKKKRKKSHMGKVLHQAASSIMNNAALCVMYTGWRFLNSALRDGTAVWGCRESPLPSLTCINNRLLSSGPPEERTRMPPLKSLFLLFRIGRAFLVNGGLMSCCRNVSKDYTKKAFLTEESFISLNNLFINRSWFGSWGSFWYAK